MDKQIDKLIKVVRALTQLVLEIGTLTAVIKMVVESRRAFSVAISRMLS